jgi:1,2-diacylglycerol 3-beta-galactosyltransferase
VAVPKRLLFLFSDTGAGHRAAAEAVAAAVNRRYPNEFQVELFDPMRDHRLLAGRLTALYGPITRRLPFLWGAAYHATNLQPTVRLFQHAIGRGLRRKLRQVLEPRPALVASFHPLLNHVAVDVIAYGVPRVTVITDWINFHKAWTDLTADCIVCPSDAAMQLCRRRGIPADRLVKAGLPIHPRFQDAIGGFSDKTAMRLKLRLRPHAPTVLLAGGGDGTEPLRKYAAALARSPLDIQVLAISGRNKALAERIREDNHVGVHVFGFVDNMPELLLASDLLVTRAGPGMIAEGLACGCPLLLTGYLPGQEEGNVKEVVDRGLGRFVPRPDDLVAAVTDWFAKPPQERVRDAEKVRAAADPGAAFQVADVLVRLASRG